MEKAPAEEPESAGAGTPCCNGKLLEEYKEATRLHRHESVLMFGQSAVYLVAAGSLYAGVLSYESKSQHPAVWIVAGVIGLILTITFFAIHARTSKHQLVAARHAARLEMKLGYHLYRQRFDGVEDVEEARDADVLKRKAGAHDAMWLIFIGGYCGNAMAIWYGSGWRGCPAVLFLAVATLVLALMMWLVFTPGRKESY